MKKIIFILTLIAAFATRLAAQEIVMDYPRLSDRFDTIFVDFKVVDEEGNKVKFGSIDKSHMHLEEIGYNGDEDITLIDVQDIRGYDPDYAANNYSILVIVDQSVSEECFKRQREALSELFQGFPKAEFFVTAMGARRTPTTLISNTYQLISWMDSSFNRPVMEPKFIYKTMASIIEEIVGEDSHDFYHDVEYNPALRDSTKKSVVLLTDGRIMNDQGGYIGGDEFFRIKTALKDGLDLNREVQFNFVYMGENATLESTQKEVQYVLKPGIDEFFQEFDLQALKEHLILRPDPVAMDYRMVILNPEHKLYDGQKITLHAYLEEDGRSAYGAKLFTMGSMIHPIPAKISKTEKVNIWVNCFISGLIIILLLYLIFRIVIPRCKYFVFKKRYVKTFEKANVLPIKARDYVAQKCYFCKDDFVPGDEIVTKCEHTMHYECWKQNGHLCPEYGRECAEGRFYYNEEHPWDKRNAPYYLKNILIGAFLGIIAWSLFKALTNNTMFYDLIGNLITLSGKVGIDASGYVFKDKIHDLLFFGVVVEFCITLIGSWLVERRKKTINRILLILLRGFIGAFAGFIAGFIGGVVAIATGKDYNCFIVDIIAWLLMGISSGFVIAYRTKVNVKRAVIGGGLFAMLGFCVLYLFNFDDSDFSFQYIGLLVSFLCMLAVIIYASGLFSLLAAPEKVSERYFLHIEGTPKVRDVAIYKWMNRIGGYRMVTIGKSETCYIDMYWDDTPGIEGVQGEVYMENDVPYYKNMSSNKAVRLTHGSTFTIGKTLFTYIEKDCI